MTDKQNGPQDTDHDRPRQGDAASKEGDFGTNAENGDTNDAGARLKSGTATGSHDNTGYPSGNSSVPSGTDVPMGERTGQPGTQEHGANAASDDAGPRPNTGRPADQGEEFDEAEAASTERGNEGSGWQGGGA